MSDKTQQRAITPVGRGTAPVNPEPAGPALPPVEAVRPVLPPPRLPSIPNAVPNSPAGSGWGSQAVTPPGSFGTSSSPQPVTNQRFQIGDAPGRNGFVTQEVAPHSPAPVVNAFSQLQMVKAQELAQQLRPRDQPYYVPPEPGITASNNPSRFPIIVENGMNMSPEGITAMGQGVANRFGRPVYVVPNHTEGVPKDIQNCVISAYTDRAGFQVEKDAATHLAKAFIARLNDTHPVEINCYSQGTLITQDVLSQLRSHLVNEGREAEWKGFAARVDLRTYGAALHRWPAGIVAKECRHAGDPVAVIGDFVTLYHGAASLLRGQFDSRRAEITVLPVFKDAHSIQLYLDNSAKFYLQSISKLSPAEKATELVTSMNRSEFSNKEYDSIVTQGCLATSLPSARASEVNKAIHFSRELIKQLAQSPQATNLLELESIEKLVAASLQELREVPRQMNRIERKFRPGSMLDPPR